MTENVTRNNPWMRKKGPGLSKKSTACLIHVQASFWSTVKSSIKYACGRHASPPQTIIFLSQLTLGSMGAAEGVCQNPPQGQGVDFTRLAIDNLAAGGNQNRMGNWAWPSFIERFCQCILILVGEKEIQV